MIRCESVVRYKHIRPVRCGVLAARYQVFARPASQEDLEKNSKQISFAAIRSWHIERGTAFVTQALCEKHLRAAKRQGREVLPI